MVLEQDVQALKTTSFPCILGLCALKTDVLKVFFFNGVGEMPVARKFGLCDNFVVM